MPDSCRILKSFTTDVGDRSLLESNANCVTTQPKFKLYLSHCLYLTVIVLFWQPDELFDVLTG